MNCCPGRPLVFWIGRNKVADVPRGTKEKSQFAFLGLESDDEPGLSLCADVPLPEEL